MDSKLFEFLITPICPLMWVVNKAFPDKGTGAEVGVGLLILFGLIVSFYGGLIVTAVLSWWGYAVIAYVAFYAVGYSMMCPPKPEETEDDIRRN